ncbi:transporter, monovalent cation:proton antiporter-2 family [gut metagenome]|uniref:Transporter, monovalent cation:proton antiporter-2 family n=1 Tax=gut metagenome TaxID=749906 RepID=J9D4Y2_9ZZZZ
MTLLSSSIVHLPITDPTWIFFIVLSIILFAPMLLERLRVPAIVGMIFAGILVGPHGFHVLDRDGSFELFGKVGLYYIMFLASLEMNLQDVQKIKGRAMLLGLLSFLFPLLLGFGANQALGYGVAASVLMASMYASHTLIAYPIVLKYGLTRRKAVSIAVGGTIVADTLVLLVLAVVGGMFKEHTTDNYLLWLLLRVIFLGGAIILVFPWLARKFFRSYDDSIVQYIFVLALVFLGAGLMEFVGMEGILGAFLVGIVLNRSIPPASPLMNHIEFVGNALFIPYFLIGVGMLINVQAFVDNVNIFLLAGVMILVGLTSKWLAAYVTQRTFRMQVEERNLMFGLTNSRAAATLAVVLVGYRIILPDGSRLLGEEVLNGAMMFILVTCVVSSFVTEGVCRKLAVTSTAQTDNEDSTEDRILIALANPQTVGSLVHTALMLRTPKSNIPLTALNVVLEDDPESRENGLKELERAVKIGAAANVRLVTRSRWSVNVVSGISHTMKEFNASDLLLGLHEKDRLTDTFFGKLTTDLIAAVERQIIISKNIIPLNTITRMHVLIPRKAEFEPGFNHCAERLALLASQLSCRVDTYGGRGTLAAMQDYWESKHHSVVAEQHVYTEWRDLISIAHNTSQNHLIVLIAARKGTLSRHSYMNKLPEQIERYFSSRNVMIIYPMQLATATSNTTSVRTAVPVKMR